jgi:hypothetical protein
MGLELRVAYSPVVDVVLAGVGRGALSAPLTT